MKRFRGMMPSSEVKKEVNFKTEGIGNLGTIQASESGWTIIYGDYSTQFKDEVDSTENNFNKALYILKSKFQDITFMNSRTEGGNK